MDHLDSNKFICSQQSDFIRGDSTVSQLMEINEVSNEVRTVFCDISKSFDRV